MSVTNLVTIANCNGSKTLTLKRGNKIMTQHTQGKWRVTHQTATDCAFDVISNGELVASCGKTQDKNSRIAANAHLIAAAPELLEALRCVLDHTLIGGIQPQKTMEKVQAAINKARGLP